jgi:hypothetical protein
MKSGADNPVCEFPSALGVPASARCRRSTPYVVRYRKGFDWMLSSFRKLATMPTGAFWQLPVSTGGYRGLTA